MIRIICPFSLPFLVFGVQWSYLGSHVTFRLVFEPAFPNQPVHPVFDVTQEAKVTSSWRHTHPIRVEPVVLVVMVALSLMWIVAGGFAGQEAIRLLRQLEEARWVSIWWAFRFRCPWCVFADAAHRLSPAALANVISVALNYLWTASCAHRTWPVMQSIVGMFGGIV